MQRWQILGLTGLVFAASNTHSFAQSGPSFWLDARFEAVPPHVGGSFGWACATADDYTVIGVPGLQAGGFSVGGAFVFHREPTTWSAQVLQSATPLDFAQVGASVAMDSTRIVLGALGEHEVFYDAGAVYVFERAGATWTQCARLVAPNPTASAQFGKSVAISGDDILVGARSATGAAVLSGAAYMFHFDGTTWNLAQTLTASDGGWDDQFGWSVALQGDTAVVGAIFAPGQSSFSGSAYVFSRSGAIWSEVAKVVPPSGPIAIEFGTVVAIDFDVLAISESSGTFAPAHPGAVHVWHRTTGAWLYEARIQPADLANTDQFASSMALAGERIVAGAPKQAALQPGAGSTYVFQRNGASWAQVAKLTASDGEIDDGFGASVAISTGIVITAPTAASATGHNAGAAYQYAMADIPLVGAPYCRGDSSAGNCRCGNYIPGLPPAGCKNSRGIGAGLQGFGSASVAANNIQLACTGLVPDQPAYLIGSLASPNHGLGRVVADGLLCLGSPRVRLGARTVDQSGAADWNDLFGSPSWTGGETWHFQVWYRDYTAGSCGFGGNLSNALELDLLP